MQFTRSAYVQWRQSIGMNPALLQQSPSRPTNRLLHAQEAGRVASWVILKRELRFTNKRYRFMKHKNGHHCFPLSE